MLVRDDDLIVGQPAHAWVSGQLARAWGNAAFPAPAPYEDVCLAAEQHDVGWADADLAPLLNPAGRPRSFREMPRAVHIAIWRDAAPRMLAQSRYAALLVSLHGTSLYERVEAGGEGPELAAAIGDYMAGERALQAQLSAGLDADEIDRNRRLILALDRLSLALCHGDETMLRDVPGTGGPATIRVRRHEPDEPNRQEGRYVLDPWPFAVEALEVGCEARRLPGTFDDEAALHAALAAAPWVALRWTLSPG